MATVTGELIATLGIHTNLSVAKVTAPGTATVTIPMPGLRTVKGAIVQVLDSGNRVVTSDADVTFSGGNVVVADGGTFSLADTYIIHVFAWGEARR